MRAAGSDIGEANVDDEDVAEVADICEGVVEEEDRDVAVGSDEWFIGVEGADADGRPLPTPADD